MTVAKERELIAAVAIKTLHEKLSEITAEVGRMKATSTNQYGKVAIGIADVEDELREQFSSRKILTFWDTLKIEQLNPENKLFGVTLKVTLVNAEDPSDKNEGTSIDIGTNPMAAASFAVKGYYKRLFHLGDDERNDDQRASTAVVVPGRKVAASVPITPKPAPLTKTEAAQKMGPLAYMEGFPCVVEGCTGKYVVASKGSLKGRLICDRMKEVDGVKKFDGHVVAEEDFARVTE